MRQDTPFALLVWWCSL